MSVGTYVYYYTYLNVSDVFYTSLPKNVTYEAEWQTNFTNGFCKNVPVFELGFNMNMMA